MKIEQIHLDTFDDEYIISKETCNLLKTDPCEEIKKYIAKEVVLKYIWERK